MPCETWSVLQVAHRDGLDVLDLYEVRHVVVEERAVERDVVALRVEVPELRREDLLGLRLVVVLRRDLAAAGDGELDEVADVRLEQAGRPERGGDDRADRRELARVDEHRAARGLHEGVEVGHVVGAVVADDGRVLAELHLVVEERAEVVLGLVLVLVGPAHLLQAVLGADVEIVRDPRAGLEGGDVLGFAVDTCRSRTAPARATARRGPRRSSSCRRCGSSRPGARRASSGGTRSRR